MSLRGISSIGVGSPGATWVASGSLRVSGCRGLLGSAWGHFWGHCCRLCSLFPFVEEVILGSALGPHRATLGSLGVSWGHQWACCRQLGGHFGGRSWVGLGSLRGSLLGWLGVALGLVWGHSKPLLAQAGYKVAVLEFRDSLGHHAKGEAGSCQEGGRNQGGSKQEEGSWQGLLVGDSEDASWASAPRRGLTHHEAEEDQEFGERSGLGSQSQHHEPFLDLREGRDGVIGEHTGHSCTERISISLGSLLGSPLGGH